MPATSLHHKWQSNNTFGPLCRSKSTKLYLDAHGYDQQGSVMYEVYIYFPLRTPLYYNFQQNNPFFTFCIWASGLYLAMFESMFPPLFLFQDKFVFDNVSLVASLSSYGNDAKCRNFWRHKIAFQDFVLCNDERNLKRQHFLPAGKCLENFADLNFNTFDVLSPGHSCNPCPSSRTSNVDVLL